MKGTPLAYNKDFQEVWQFMFDTRDTILDCLNITIGIINNLTIFPQKMKSSILICHKCISLLILLFVLLRSIF